MEICTIGEGIGVDEALDAYLRRRIDSVLGCFSNRVRFVSVVLSGKSTPKGGRDKRCRVWVTLDHPPILVIGHADFEVRAAIDRALYRLGPMVARRLDPG